MKIFRKHPGIVVAIAISAVLIGSVIVVILHMDKLTRSDFQVIDSVSQSLALSNLGSVKLDKKSGGRQLIEGELATRNMIVIIPSRSPQDVQTELGLRLATIGYTTPDLQPGDFCSSSSSCRYANQTSAVEIDLIIYSPGEEIRAIDPDHPMLDLIVPQDDTGVLIDMSKT